MTSGGGFEYTDDSVIGRIEFDVDAEGVTTMRELTREVQQFRVEIEAAVRGNQDFVGYLNQITEASNKAAEALKNGITQMQQSSEMQQRIQAGQPPTAPSRGAPGYFVDNFANMTSGTGENRGPAALSTTDQRAYLNYQAAAGKVRPGDLAQAPTVDDITAATTRVQQREAANAERLGQNVPMTEGVGQIGRGAQEIITLAAGSNRRLQQAQQTSLSGMARMLGQVRTGAGALGEGVGPAAAALGGGEAGNAGIVMGSGIPADAAASGAAVRAGASGLGGMTGGAGGALAGLGTAAGVVGALFAANAGIQQGGEIYQGWKNMGAVRGGGAAEGFGYEMQIRSMALNPFLTTEQSRQIIQSALTEGYTGKQFDTVTQFMAPQPLDSLVLTPTGWIKMGELRVGDRVVGAADGNPRTILGIKDWGRCEVAELTFQDGTTARSALDHKWLVHSTCHSSGPRLKTIRHMLTKPLTFNAGPNLQPRWRVPLTAPVEYEQTDPLPLDPYLLGLLLGDGSFPNSIGHSTRVRLHCCIEGDEYHFSLPEGVTVRHVVRPTPTHRFNSTYNFGVSKGIQQEHRRGRPVNPLKLILNDLGLLGTKAPTKFIPEPYLSASVVNRVALLQGLIDTDGCISKEGSVSFTSTSRMLIDGVTDLVRSLGGIARIAWRNPKKSLWGGTLPLGTVAMRFPPGVVPARLPRKVARYRPSLTTERRASKAIVDIKPIGDDYCRCISLSETDGSDSLYITDNYTTTSNSNLKDMNVQVADSVQLLRKNVTEGGQSLAGLNSSLATLKEMSKTGASSFPELLANFQQTSAGLITAGVPGGPAAQQAMEATQGWNTEDTRALKGVFPQTVNAWANNTQAQSLVRMWGGYDVPQGLFPQGYADYLGGRGEWNQAVSNTLKQLVSMFFRNPEARQKGTVAYENGVTQFQMYLQKIDPQNPAATSRTEAENMVDAILAGKDPAVEGKQKTEEITSQQRPRSFLERAGGTVTNAIGSVVNAAMGTPTSIFGMWQYAAPTWKGLTTGDWSEEGETWNRNIGNVRGSLSRAEVSARNPYSNPVYNSILNQFGAQGIELLDEQGNVHKVDYSQQQMQGLASQQWRWRRKGEQTEGITLAETPQELKKDFRTSGGTQNTNVTGQVQVNVGLTNDARRLLTVTPSQQNAVLTPNQQAALAGHGNNQMNNPPPGDTVGRNGYVRGTGGW